LFCSESTYVFSGQSQGSWEVSFVQPLFSETLPILVTYLGWAYVGCGYLCWAVLFRLSLPVLGLSRLGCSTRAELIYAELTSKGLIWNELI
jgi:hypothetical protein